MFLYSRNRLPFVQVSSLFSQKRFFSGKELIINAVGSDRCGIVSDMTKYVTEAGGNVGESQAARLGKHFSLMMVVSIPDDKLSGLLDQLDNMSDLNASVFEASEESSSKATTTVACMSWYFSIYILNAWCCQGLGQYTFSLFFFSHCFDFSSIENSRFRFWSLHIGRS
jgi:predicted amino acid-binding ACT domain protein